MLVGPEARGQGIGSALIAACEAQARREGFPGAFVTTITARGLLLRRCWRLLRALPDGHEVLHRDLE